MADRSGFQPLSEATAVQAVECSQCSLGFCVRIAKDPFVDTARCYPEPSSAQTPTRCISSLDCCALSFRWRMSPARQPIPLSSAEWIWTSESLPCRTVKLRHRGCRPPGGGHHVLEGFPVGRRCIRQMMDLRQGARPGARAAPRAAEPAGNFSPQCAGAWRREGSAQKTERRCAMASADMRGRVNRSRRPIALAADMTAPEWPIRCVPHPCIRIMQ